MFVVREGWVEVVLVEVDGGEEENAGAGGDEGVAEDEVPVGEVVEETPVVPLLYFYQKIVQLHRKTSQTKKKILQKLFPLFYCLD